jgi:hypothetical protein
MKKIECRTCTYYFITWDKDHPHGCRAIGFKSRDLPCRLVFKTSGRQRLNFAPKATPVKQTPKLRDTETDGG